MTFQLDDELLRQAKVLAANRDTSVTQLVREGLEQQIAFAGPLERTGAAGTYETLVAYALGQVPRAAAMERLGIGYYGDLLALLGAAGLPTPTVPAATRAEMVADMLSVLRAAGESIPERGRGLPGATEP